MSTRLVVVGMSAGLLFALILFSLGYRSLSHVSSDGVVVSKKIAGHPVLNIFTGTPEAGKALANALVIFQEKEGAYWIGTQSGIYRQTKNEWSEMRDPIEPDFAHGAEAICQSADGKVWLRSLVPQYIQLYTGTGWHKIEAIQSSRITGYPRALFNGKADRVWLCLAKGLFVYDGYQWSCVSSPPDELHRLLSNSGLKKPSEQSTKLEEIVKKWEKKSNGTSYGPRQSAGPEGWEGLGLTTCGLEDSDGNIWIASTTVILMFDTNNQEWRVIDSPSGLAGVSRVYEDRQHRLWFGDRTGQVSVLDRIEKRWVIYSIKDHFGGRTDGSPFFIKGIFQERTGRMLFATERGLVALLENEDRWEYFSSKNSDLPGDEITALMEDRDGKLWLGTNMGVVVLGP